MKLQESQTVEFKQTWRDEYLKTVCAFANTDGGTFCIGVNDRGEVIGVNNVKKLIEDLPNKVMNAFVIAVDVQTEMSDEKQFVKMTVPKSNLALSYHGKFYTRSGTTTQELKGGALQRLLLAVLNSIIHRDYTSSSSIELRVFDQSISLWNYGKLEDMSIADLCITHNSNPRNSLIAQIFYRAGYIESWRRGTLTIINETKKVGLPEPIFKDYLNGVQLIFERNPYKITSEPLANEKLLNERQKIALNYVKEYSSITNKIYQELNNCSGSTAKRDLMQLVSMEFFEIEGSGRNIQYINVKY